MDLGGAARLFAGMAVLTSARRRAALERAARIVRDECRRLPGNEQPEWAELAESTLAEKARLGLPSPSPLRRTGELAMSYQCTVNGETEAWVGSNNPKAVWHELGTSRGLPARPVIRLAAVRKEKEVVEAVGRVVFGGLTLK